MATVEQDLKTISFMPVAQPLVDVRASAAERLSAMMREKALEGYALRVFVSGGGCSGLSYNLTIEHAGRPDDRVFESQGITIYLDPKSALFVSGTEIDWQESMMGAGFAFKNPVAKGTCGCGTSFTA